MKVVVDAHMVGHHETGNETYTVNLLRGLAEVAPKEIIAAFDPMIDLPHVLQSLPFPKPKLSSSSNWRRLFFSLSQLCRQWQADLLHVTYIAPFFSSCPVVVSVHDISFRRFPDYFSPRDRLLFATLLPLSLRRAAAVLTLSNHAREEILAAFPFLAGKVHVIYLAAKPGYAPPQDQSQLDGVRARYGLPPVYILAVGNLQPRKNLIRLIKAFAAARRRIPEASLVIVGKDQWQSSQIYTLVQSLNVEDRVIFTGYVPEVDLPLLYGGAHLFVYPSVYEGFGLPILEAMACGTPVVTTAVSSMPEVAGDAALLVDPHDTAQMADAIVRVMTEPTLASQLAQAGLDRAALFSWQQTARDTLAVYKTVLKNRSRG